MALVLFEVAVLDHINNPNNTLAATAIQIRTTGVGTPLASIFSDEAGLNSITQPGAVTDSFGVFSFYADVDLASYTANYTASGSPRITALDSGDHSKLTNKNEVGAHDTIYDRSFKTLAAALSTAFATSADGIAVKVKDNILDNAGGGLWDLVLTSSVTPNTTNIRQSVGNPLLSLVLRESVGAMVNFGVKANPSQYGVLYGTGLTLVQRQDNTIALQKCFDRADEIENQGKIETQESVFVREGLNIRGFHRSKAEIRNFHATQPAITDSTISAPNDQGNNTRYVKIHNMTVASENGDAIHVTPYQWAIDHVTMSAPLGACIHHHDGGYQVENTYADNYFNAFKHGILANVAGFRAPTDQIIKDNYFNANGFAERHIDMVQASGSLFKGNHYYGGSAKEFCKFTGGINTRIIGEYYEAMDNPRLLIIGGNPGSWAISSCSFWKGDGSNVDYNGDVSALIAYAGSAFNLSKLTLSSNVFEGGSNDVPIFNLLNGASNDTGGMRIMFDKSNDINGDYLLSTFGASGSGSIAHIIQSDHPEFYKFDTAQSPSLSGIPFSEYFQENVANATGFPALPGSASWLRNKKMIINNVSGVHTMSFNAGGGPATITGLNPVPPSTRVAIIERSGDYFIYRA